MKKIFGLFAMAAVAATGLTCCGGGGGGDNLEGSTIKFFEVGTSAGTMYVTVLSKSGANSSYTITRFGGLGQSKNNGEIVEHSNSKDPNVKIPDEVTKVRHVSVSLDSYDDATNNREATGFYSSITGAATTNGNNGNNGNGGNDIDFDFPQTWITMMLNRLPWKQTEIILSFLRLHPSTAFQTLVDSEGYSISSKGFLSTVVYIMVIRI